MHREVSPQKRQFAKNMRLNATQAERRLWALLRAGRFEGLKFKRQVPLDGYILDFVCFDRKLIIEADGGQHSESDGDKTRDAHFLAQGYVTLRIWNNDILTNIEGVTQRISEAVRTK